MIPFRHQYEKTALNRAGSGDVSLLHQQQSSFPEQHRKGEAHRRAGSDATPSGEPSTQAAPAWVDLHVWDAGNALPESTVQLLDKIAVLCQSRPMPSVASGASAVEDSAIRQHAPSTTAAEPTVQTSKPAKSSSRTNTRMVLRDAAQFYKWHNDLMDTEAHRRDEQYKQYALLLESYLKACDGIIVQIDGVLELFERLSAKQQDSRKKTITMLDTFRQLDGECQALQKVADSLAIRSISTGLPSHHSGNYSGNYAGSHAGSAVNVPIGRAISYSTPERGGSYDGGSQAGAPGGPFKGPLQNGPQVQAGASGSRSAQQLESQSSSVASWISSTLGVDESTVSSLLRIW